jgi:HAD superfamily hydrolase (TIGR01490 family)
MCLSGAFEGARQVGAGGYAVDAKQSDGFASGRGICRREFVRARPMGESCGGCADGNDDCVGCFGWAYRAAEKSCDSGWRAARHSRRPHDRKRVLHVFRRGGHGVVVAAGFLLCARGGDRLFAWLSDARGALRVGRERDAADVVGTGAGGVALEPRFVCGDEVPLLLLFGFGIGVDARTRGVAGGNDYGFALVSSRWRARLDVDDGGFLFVACIARTGRGMAVCFERGPSAQSEESGAGGDVMRKEVREVQEVEEVKEKSEGVAAFFDLDGTLAPMPSLESRFFRMLRYRKLIGVRNLFLWLREALRLIPYGIIQVVHANKMYLRGVRTDVECGGTDIPVCLRLAGKTEEKRRRQARMPVPLYPEAIECVVWHVERGHLIVIVSGTLEPLAERAARGLEAELAKRGLATKIWICATRLEQSAGSWTGQILGEAMFGEAKARAVRRIAAEENLDLRRCFAYGDSSSDKWMLEAVGKPAAVNPSSDLARIARRNEWTVLRWGKEKNFTQRAQRAQRTQRADESDRELQAARAKTGFGA